MNKKDIFLSIILIVSINCLSIIDLNSKDFYLKIKQNVDINEVNLKLQSDFNFELEESILPFRSSLTSKYQFINQIQLDDKIQNILRKEEPLLRTFRISIDDAFSKKNIIQKINDYEETEYLEEVREAQFLGTDDFNDPFLSDQSVLFDMKAFEAWEINEGDSSIVIGISDSGLDQYHEDINPNLFRFWGEIPNNGIDDDMNGYFDDFIGVSLENQRLGSGGGNTATNVSHGLNVAGIAGAAANNGKGIVGTGNKCRIFPIKISQGTGSSIIYGYESIIYAAVNEFDVLNCSWGTQGIASPIEQSIVDYAISRNVVIVASAGNTESSFVVEERVLDWYPAGYNGVISVGSMSDDEVMYTRSSINPGVDVVVQGERNYTTSTNNNYTRNGISGTSFASPVISGAIGVFKNHFPSLNPFEIEQIVRYSGRSVIDFNMDWEKIMPKYFDFQKMMQFEANTILAIKKENHRFYKENGDSIYNFTKGDEINLSFDVINYFNNLSNVKFTLSIGKEFVPGYVEILNNEVTVPNISKNEKLNVNGFKLKLLEESYQRVIFRVDYQVNGKKEFFLIPFDNMPSMTHFENDIIKLSLSNDGKIGFDSELQEHGYGFNDKKSGNPILYSGFIGYADNVTFSGTSGDGPNSSDINVETNFSNVKNVAKYNINNIPVTYENKVILSNDSNYRWAKFEIKIESNSNYDDFAFGIVGDYDIGIYGNAYQNNNTEYFENGNYSDGNIKSKTQIAYNSDEGLYFGISAISNDNEAEIQSAGLTSDESYSILPANIKSTLSSGESIQLDFKTDIGFVSGVRFIEGIKNGESKECAFCLSMASSKEELEKYLRNCVLGITTSVEVKNQDDKDIYFSNDRFTFINFENSLFNAKLIDIQGKVIFNYENIELSELENVNFDLKSGVYFLNLYNKYENYNFKLLKSY